MSEKGPLQPGLQVRHDLLLRPKTGQTLVKRWSNTMVKQSGPGESSRGPDGTKGTSGLPKSGRASANTRPNSGQILVKHWLKYWSNTGQK
jgi:hypothetical protein